MRFLFPLACFAVMVAPTIAACSSQAVCECPELAPSVTMTVTDAVTGQTVPNPSFTVNGQPTSGGCIGTVSDAGTNCQQWRVTLPVGHSTVTVAATGYQTQTFQYDTTMGTGCCASGTQLQQLVSLTK
jgi:hypothetical protein